jgi:hypothetical protein
VTSARRAPAVRKGSTAKVVSLQAKPDLFRESLDAAADALHRAFEARTRDAHELARWDAWWVAWHAIRTLRNPAIDARSTKIIGKLAASLRGTNEYVHAVNATCAAAVQVQKDPSRAGEHTDYWLVELVRYGLLGFEDAKKRAIERKDEHVKLLERWTPGRTKKGKTLKAAGILATVSGISRKRIEMAVIRDRDQD